jgi:hypothetical protein
MKLLIFAASLLTAVPALADSIELEGHYARDGACGIPSGSYPESDNYALISSDQYSGPEWACSFAWVSEIDVSSTYVEEAWTAISQCLSEGEPYSQLLTIQRTGPTVLVTNAADADRTDLVEKCPQ